MRNDPALMRTERNLWRGATTMAIGILLLMMLQTRPEHRDITTPRFDEPGAAPRVCSPLFIPPFAHDPATNNIWLGGKVHSIVVDPDDRPRLYLGTDLGVMVSIDSGRTWTEETGFGPAVTMWLSLIRTPAGQKQLFAFTHGRGAWRVTLR
jgi:hypothetical protein